MIHKISGSSFLEFGSYYYEPVNFNAHRLVCRQQMTQKKSITQLLYFSCEVRIELIEGIASIVIGNSIEELRTFSIHHYLKIKPNTYFNLIALSEEITYHLITPDTPSIAQLEVPYQYPSFYSHLNVSEILDCYTTNVAQYRFHSSVHQYYELLYVSEGTLTVTLSGTTYTLSPHDLIVCGPDTPYPRQIATDTPCNYLTIIFDMNNLENDDFLTQTFSCPTILQSTLNKLIKQSNVSSTYANTLMLCYLQEVITQLMQLSESQRQNGKEQQSFHNDLLQQILSYMNYHVTEPITIEEICHKFFMSRSSLQALFKTHLHTSPKNYLINIKLQKSKELIQENQHTISEIAYLLGFSSIHYFSRLFKKYFNLSPSEYAKQVSYSEAD